MVLHRADVGAEVAGDAFGVDDLDDGPKRPVIEGPGYSLADQELAWDEFLDKRIRRALDGVRKLYYQKTQVIWRGWT
jgi:hypothetical protein